MFEVSWCLVGEVPDAQPFMFRTFEEARQFLQDELYWFARDVEDNDAKIDAGEAAMTVKNAEGKDLREFVFVVGNISYWLIETKSAFPSFM